MPDRIDSHFYSLDFPSELSLAEYQDISSEIADLTNADLQLDFLDAARYNDIDLLRAILRKCRQDDDANAQQTVLLEMINFKHFESGNTALHMACANGHVDLVKFLLHYHADAQVANASGNTPLHWAASNGQEAVCKVLLECSQHSIDVLQRNEFGRSALTEGFASGKEGVVQSLLEHESASEEKLLSTPGGKSQQESVIHVMIFNGVTVKVREQSMASSVDDGILGSAEEDTTGLGVWPASLVAAQWIARQHFGDEVSSILELGAGCGVPSLVAASVCQRAAAVYSTDWNDKSLKNLQFNVQLNSRAAAIQVQCMDWSDKCTWPSEKVDLLLGSDLIYTRESVPLLVATVQGLLSPRGRFLYTAPTLLARQGKDEFLQAMKGHFNLTSREAPPEFMGNPLVSGDEDECFLHFNELQTTGYMLHEFVWRQTSDADMDES